MRRPRPAVLALTLLLATAACGTGEVDPGGGGGGVGADGGGGGGGGGGGPDAAIDTSDLAFCVDETNRYRATLDLAPLARSAALEAYAAEGAQIDHESGEPHKHFIDTNGGGIAFAENEIPRWPLGTVREVIEQGLAQMWAEGPGGGHYENMRGAYESLGCGIYQADGMVTVVQDYGF